MVEDAENVKYGTKLSPVEPALPNVTPVTAVPSVYALYPAVAGPAENENDGTTELEPLSHKQVASRMKFIVNCEARLELTAVGAQKLAFVPVVADAVPIQSAGRMVTEVALRAVTVPIILI